LLKTKLSSLLEDRRFEIISINLHFKTPTVTMFYYVSTENYLEKKLTDACVDVN